MPAVCRMTNCHIPGSDSAVCAHTEVREHGRARTRVPWPGGAAGLMLCSCVFCCSFCCALPHSCSPHSDPLPPVPARSHIPATMLSQQWDLALSIIVLPESARICGQTFVAELWMGWERSELRSPGLLHKGSSCSLHIS